MARKIKQKFLSDNQSKKDVGALINYTIASEHLRATRNACARSGRFFIGRPLITASLEFPTIVPTKEGDPILISTLRSSKRLSVGAKKFCTILNLLRRYKKALRKKSRCRRRVVSNGRTIGHPDPEWIQTRSLTIFVIFV